MDENCDGYDGPMLFLEINTNIDAWIAANPDPVTAGGELTYTIEVANFGAVPVAGITIVNVFPAQCTSVSWTTPAAGGVRFVGNIGAFLTLSARSGVTYTATCQVDAAASGSFTNTVTVGPPAGFYDIDSSNNAASVSVTVNAPAPKSNAQDLIGDLQRQRADMILANGPDSGRRIDRLNGGTGGSEPLAYRSTASPFAIVGGNDTLAFSYAPGKRPAAGETAYPLSMPKDGTSGAPGQRWDIWLEGSYSRFDAAAGSGNFGILHTGADYLFTPDLLAGIGTQFDWIDMDAATGDGSANGWGFMVGPYMTARLAPSLYRRCTRRLGPGLQPRQPARHLHRQCRRRTLAGDRRADRRL